MSVSENKVRNSNGSPRLLIVKLGAIGDVVMAIPAAYAMHQQGYAIDWLCSEAIAPVLRLYPWIRVIGVQDGPLVRGSFGQKLGAMLSVWRRFFSYRCDTCAILYYDPRYKWLILPVRARHKFLLSKTDRGARLLPGRHHTDEFARVLATQMVKSYAENEAPTQLPPVQAEGLPPNPVPRADARARVVLFPAGARNAMRDDALRRWPLESYRELANALLARGYEVLIAGGPEDAWANAAFDAMPVRNLIGKLKLTETLALLDGSDVTVTHDTGPLHLAGLTATAIVAIFGPTDPRGRLPQRANCIALWGGEGFACRPCYDGFDYAPCTNNGCVQQITAAMVLGEVETLLVAQREKKPLPPRVRTPKHTATPIFIRPQEAGA